MSQHYSPLRQSPTKQSLGREDRRNASQHTFNCNNEMISQQTGRVTSRDNETGRETAKLKTPSSHKANRTDDALRPYLAEPESSSKKLTPSQLQGNIQTFQSVEDNATSRRSGYATNLSPKVYSLENSVATNQHHSGLRKSRVSEGRNTELIEQRLQEEYEYRFA